MNPQSRRQFLTRSAGAALGAAALAPFAARSAHAAPADRKWVEEVDVIVVGTGIAGTIAAIAAAEKGSKVLMLEKMSFPGGTSLVSGLDFACVGSPLQKEKGVMDAPELLAGDMAKVSGGFGSYERALLMAKTTARVEAFLTAHGVRWDGRLLKLGGHSVARGLSAQGGGAGMLSALWNWMKAHSDIQIRMKCRAEEVLMNDKGEVTGLRVREGYVFSRNADDDWANATGVMKTIRARQAVVFATGGYAQDKAFRSSEVPFLAGVVSTTNAGATAGSLKTLEAAGAQAVQLSLFRFAYPLPTEDMIWGMLIDPATGRRFMSEGETRNTLASAVLQHRLRNGDRKPFIVWDEKALKKFHNMKRLEQSLADKNGIDGAILKFASLDELAKHYSTDDKALKESLVKYNELIAGGRDTEFNKPMERSGRKVEPLSAEGPFYTMVVTPRLNYTPGGIRTNEKALAIRLRDGAPIPRLYVAGEASGGLHGQERLTACSMPDCSSFGLIAGENAAAEKRS